MTLTELEATEPMRRVCNATGVLLHTNLGRAPLDGRTTGGSDEGVHGGRDSSSSTTNVEFDLHSGRRGRRFAGLEPSLCALTGAPAALVVNNNAAAVLLALTAVAGSGEVVVSRGELVEIGGSFRIPDVIAQGGAVLREIGTTNRTHTADYRDAMGATTGAVLSVHRSNYRIEGFTAVVGHRELVEVARSADVPLVVDLGGGLVDTRCGWLEGGPPRWLADEPGVRQVVAAGADVVTFSGDKLLGGPQGGIIVGRSDLVERMRSHPLARAVRLDGVRAEILQRTVDAYLERTAGTAVPLWRLASVPLESLRSRAAAIVDRVESSRGSTRADLEVVPMAGTVGAGAAPGSRIPGVGIEVSPGGQGPRPSLPGGMSLTELSERLRAATVPVIAVQGDGRLRIHLRTVEESDDAVIADALVRALAI